jgi:hypothetical protein
MKNEAIFIDEKKNTITYRDKRAYECTDAENYYVPSCTSILDCAPKGQGFYEFLKNRGKEADAIAMEAMEKGSRIHNATEIYDGEGIFQITEPDKWTADEVEMLYRYKEFSDRYVNDCMVIEGSLASKSLGFGGTIDRIIRHDGKIYLLDIKTGNIYTYYWRQLAAYKVLFEYFNPKIKINHIGIIHLKALTRTDKDWQGKGWQVLFPEEKPEYYYDLFLNTKKEFHLLYPNFRANNRIFNSA